MKAITIKTPAGFCFAATVFGHGWHQLPPFRYLPEQKALERTHQFNDGGLARLVIHEGEPADTLTVEIENSGRLTRQRQTEVEQSVRNALNLGLDLQPFYQTVRRNPKYRWVEKMGAGRLLVSPTVWEDLAKTLLTTNTTWVVTVQMCKRLATLGEAFGDGLHSFPTPERIAEMPVNEFHEHVRAGYRSVWLHELATAIVAGKTDPESWRTPTVSSSDLFRQIKTLKGFGDYAAGSMCRLLGRFDRLGLDSVCRANFREQFNGGLPAKDSEIAAWYESFGEWCGLALWMDVIRDHMTTHVAKTAK
ncbi:DNA-3-methyladenine glycosylase family protein [Zavarzinella formosa]|uniref:DNA-3-methyladenine glycosylase family protein n=1 Tax=Zavarzinella formosa TaxID=360055 RepID=UPI0002F48DB4|nr:hypothetical protein [Zavarzinella formosa]